METTRTSSGRLFGVSVAAIPFILLASCAGHIQTYDGTKRANSEIAILRTSDFLYKVDGKHGPRVRFSQPMFWSGGNFGGEVLELLPGTHVLELAHNKSSPVTTVSFVAQANVTYLTEDAPNSCMQIIERDTKKPASSVACPESTRVVCDEKSKAECATLVSDLSGDGNCRVYKIDGKWNAEASMGLNTYNSSWSGNLEISLPSGTHSFELACLSGGDFDIAVSMMVVLEAGRKYRLRGEKTAGLVVPVVKPA